MARGLSAAFTQLRGAVGDYIYFAGPNHSILVRQRTDPVQPDTPSQIACRQAFASAAALWNSITQAQRQGWEAFAASLNHSHPVNRIQDTGRQAFLAIVSHRFYMAAAGLPIQAPDGTPPPPHGWLPIPKLEVIPDHPGQTGFRLRWEYDYDEDLHFVATLSPAFTPTRNRYKGPWLPGGWQRSTIPSAQVTLMNRRGLNAGSVYFIYFRAINRFNPIRFSHPQIIRAVAQTY